MNIKEHFKFAGNWIIYDSLPAMFPDVTAGPNGILLLTFCTTPDGLPCGKMYLMSSSDNGHSWCSPEVVASSSCDYGTAVNSVGITTLNVDTVIVPYSTVRLLGSYNNRVVLLYILRSTDGRITWETPVQVATDIYEPLAYGQIVELADGALLLPIWGRYKSDEKWCAGVHKSNDRDEYYSLTYDSNAHITCSIRQQGTGLE